MLRNFSISRRIVFFVIFMIALIISIAALSVRMTEGVIGDGTALAKEMLLDSQRARIKDITHSQVLGLAAMTQGQPEAEQLRIIAQYVDSARFEDDSSGYFYVYKGTVNTAHPTQKQLIGKDLASTADSRGVHYVSELYKAAQRGGGFVDFVFPKPGAGDVFKLGYAEAIAGTPFWIGTGVYIDNVTRPKVTSSPPCAPTAQQADCLWLWFSGDTAACGLPAFLCHGCVHNPPPAGIIPACPRRGAGQP